MKKLIMILLAITITNNLYAFDYESYRLRDLDEIIIESKLYNPEETRGQALIIPPQKIHLYEKLVMYPFKCDCNFINGLLVMATGLTREKLPSVNTCMQIESKSGVKIGAFIQDSIAGYVEKEYEIGQKIHLWSLWLFVDASDEKPYFVINAIGEENAEPTAPPDRR